jgi:C4-dicarboxylate-specific signal transduction histidine kinase
MQPHVFASLFILMEIGIISIIVSLLYRASIEQRRATLQAQGQNESRKVADQIDKFLRNYQKLVHLWAGAPTIAHHFNKPPAERDKDEVKRFRASLVQRVDEESKSLATMAMLNKDGQVAVGSDKEKKLEKENLSRLPDVRKALDTGRAAIGDVQVVQLVQGQPAVAVIPVLEPILDPQKRVLGLVALWLKAGRLNEIAAEGPVKSGVVSVLDAHGIRIALSVPDREKVLYRPTGPVPGAARQRMVSERRFGPDTARDLDGVLAFPQQYERATAANPDNQLFEGRTQANNETYVGGASRLKSVPWTVFFMFPEQDVTSPVVALFRRVALWCAAVVFLHLLMGVILVRGIIRDRRGRARVARQ